MPKNQFQRMAFAFLTVLVTVHSYVFYSLYVVNGNTLTSINNASGVIEAINKQGGVYMLDNYFPIWVIVLVEFILAFSLEIFIGSPMSFRMASDIFNPKKTHPVIFETTLICTTVMIMCPIMSFFATILYYPYYNGFNVCTMLANWLKLICVNFPFAFFSQIFFIQPLVRTVFKALFVRNRIEYNNI